MKAIDFGKCCQKCSFGNFFFLAENISLNLKEVIFIVHARLQILQLVRFGRVIIKVDKL